MTRKISGGSYHSNRKKKLFERAGQPRRVILKEQKVRKIRTLGGNIKTVLLQANSVNLLADGKVQKAEITNVVETPQNKFFARENRLLKGVIIETSKGKARITNRPTQEGCINAILIEKA